MEIMCITDVNIDKNNFIVVTFFVCIIFKRLQMHFPEHRHSYLEWLAICLMKAQLQSKMEFDSKTCLG